MTEKKWLTCTDPSPMHLYLDDEGLLTDRKFRLFGCGCVRTVWQDLPHDELRQAVITCERYADGLATVGELSAVRETADGIYEGIGDIIADHSAIVVTALCEPEADFPMGDGSSSGLAAVVAEIESDRGRSWDAAWKRSKKAQAHLFRCVFGNPFRPVSVDSSWLTSNVITLASSIYADYAFDRTPILADALEEAGCVNMDILNHCRGDEPHVRGCWVVDLLLGKE